MIAIFFRSFSSFFDSHLRALLDMRCVFRERLSVFQITARGRRYETYHTKAKKKKNLPRCSIVSGRLLAARNVEIRPSRIRKLERTKNRALVVCTSRLVAYTAEQKKK